MAYARGHIRSICGVLGIDPAPLLARLGVPTVAETSPHPDEPPAPRQQRDPGSLSGALADTVGGGAGAERRGPNWSAVMAAALAVVIAAGVFQVLRSGGDAAPGPVAGPVATPSVSTTPGDTASTPPPSTPSTSPSTSEGPDTVAQADGVTVVLSIPGTRSWVTVVSSSRETVFEGILSTGDRRTFKDPKKIKFVFGDAGQVNLKVNGVKLGAPGEPGQVVRTSFGPGDPTQAQA
jgi:cytoskeletal protein RodZ